MSRARGFGYPLPVEALGAFCHPEPWHALCRPVRSGTEVLAGNGYLALRVERGRWLPADFQQGSAEVLGRFGKIPWGTFPQASENWKALHEVEAQIFSHGEIHPWKESGLAPTPIWRVANEINVRLSFLQLVAKLPRAEVWVGSTSGVAPLWFRFSGGLGMIARERGIQPGEWTGRAWGIFRPGYDPLTGEKIERPKKGDGKVRLSITGSNWPPRDESEV